MIFSVLNVFKNTVLEYVVQSFTSGVVNAAFQVNDEIADRERTTRNRNGDNPATDGKIVDPPTNLVAAPRKRRQGSLLSGSGSYREVVQAAEYKESDLLSGSGSYREVVPAAEDKESDLLSGSGSYREVVPAAEDKESDLLSGSGSYREVVPAAEDKESDPGTRQSAEYMLRSPSTDVETRNGEISPVIGKTSK